MRFKSITLVSSLFSLLIILYQHPTPQDNNESGLVKVFLIFFSAAVPSCIHSFKHLDYTGKMKLKENNLKVNGSESVAFQLDFLLTVK